MRRSRKGAIRRAKKGRWSRATWAAVAFLLLWGGIALWVRWAEEQAHITPDYPAEDITALLLKERPEETDYDLLFRQTGLGRAAVNFLFEEERQDELLQLQETFFEEAEVECYPSAPFICSERLKGNGKTEIPYVEEGDILITFGCHALGWRNGHAAIVTDAEKRLAVEARVLGTDSVETSIKAWERYPNFAVLRLKDVPGEQRAEIAAYAKENLVDIPYALHAGIGESLWKLLVSRASAAEIKRFPGSRASIQGAKLLAGESVWDGNRGEQKEGKSERDGKGETSTGEGVVLSGTQCAHLVWYAYQHFGYDLDGDGGMIVTPRDLYESPLLEVVQIYGLSLEDS